MDVDAARFRRVLGQYPTGVVVVTALDPDGEPLGMTVGSFTSVSMDPPLVAFLPAKSSSSWKTLRASGERFCVNVLGSDQENVCRAVATRKSRKFHDILWHSSPGGMPVVQGAVAYIDCTLEDIHDAGDHVIVVGRVEDLDVVAGTAYPLLFFRGGYGSFSPLSLAAGDADLLEQLRLVDLARPHMEDMAARFDTEVTANSLVRDELVVAASAGFAKGTVAPTQVGQRIPFMPPLGSVFAAWGTDLLRARWIGNMGADVPDTERDHHLGLLQRVRRRGYGITLGHEPSTRLEEMSTRTNLGHPRVSQDELRDVMREVAGSYNPESIGEDGRIELHSLSVPVFDSSAKVAFTLTLWGPRGSISGHEVRDHVAQVRKTAAAATASIGGREPRAE
jgi:flavin reductase (DIM6/NTAB) family NADH-FMN oxidoreductase RutF/DNA-binding IclR family transcriptional regulator